MIELSHRSLFVSPWAALTRTRVPWHAVTGAGDGGAGAVEDDNKAYIVFRQKKKKEKKKVYIVGRPVFKVPPSSPCRANSARC
jgi:hypothetical protein